MPGDDRTIAGWSQITDYFERLDRASDRVTVQRLGQSTLKRPLIVAFISARENILALEKYKDIQRQLADTRLVTQKLQRDRLIAEGKVVVTISCSIHSTEIVGSQMSMQLAYELATAQDAETREILQNTILLLIPSPNPDGIDIVANWYRKTLGTPYEGKEPPELYHHYAGHDDNRDWFMFTQKETRMNIELVQNKYKPIITHDMHQMGGNGARIFVPPFADPFDVNMHPILQLGQATVGQAMATALGSRLRRHLTWNPARLVDAAGAVTVQADSRQRIDPKAAAAHPLLPAFRWALGARKRIAVHWSQLESHPDTEGRHVLMPLLDPGAGPRAIAILPLEDDQGAIGLMAIELDEDAPPLAGESGELVDILANQTTVAMRNAELYTRVPMIGVLEPLLRKAKGVPRGSRTWWTRVALGTVAGMGLLIPLPAAVSVDATVRPAVPIAVRAAAPGLVDEVLVVEGQTVEAGTVVARLRRDELEMQLGQVRAALQRARAEGGQARSEGSLAELRARQAEFASLTEEQSFLESELSRTELKAPVRGVVLTARTEQLRGRRLERGETLLDLADLGTMEIEAIVPEHDIQGLRAGSKAQLKVYSYPERYFRGTIARVAPRADQDRHFRVRVRVDNADGRLRPGMTGRARLDIPPRPFLWPFVMPIVRWVRFQLWI